jgi:ribonuclease Z
MEFKIHILSSGTGSPTKIHNQTAQFLILRNNYFLLDCGEATQFQLVRKKLPYMRISHIFISHLHADHYTGLIGLINTFNLNHRTTDLHVYAPEGMQEILEVQFKWSNLVLNYPLHIHQITDDLPTLIMENEELTVTTIPLDHRLPTTGFLFREKVLQRNMLKHPGIEIPIAAYAELKNRKDFKDADGTVYKWEELTKEASPPRSYAFVTDTFYMPSIVSIIKNVDVLYHEATFGKDMKEHCEIGKHSSNIEAAMIAKKAEADKLLIGHFSNRYLDFQPLLDEAREIFPNTELAIEGASFEIAFKKTEKLKIINDQLE